MSGVCGLWECIVWYVFSVMCGGVMCGGGMCGGVALPLCHSVGGN